MVVAYFYSWTSGIFVCTHNLFGCIFPANQTHQLVQVHTIHSWRRRRIFRLQTWYVLHIHLELHVQSMNWNSVGMGSLQIPVLVYIFIIALMGTLVSSLVKSISLRSPWLTRIFAEQAATLLEVTRKHDHKWQRWAPVLGASFFVLSDVRLPFDYLELILTY